MIPNWQYTELFCPKNKTPFKKERKKKKKTAFSGVPVGWDWNHGGRNICFVCGQQGRWGRNCPQRKGHEEEDLDEGWAWLTRDQVSELEINTPLGHVPFNSLRFDTYDPEDEGLTWEESEFILCHLLAVLNPHSLPTVEIQVRGSVFTLVVETGATRSVLKKSIATKSFPMSSETVIFQSANGKKRNRITDENNEYCWHWNRTYCRTRLSSVWSLSG